jgi:hypothetical protein
MESIKHLQFVDDQLRKEESPEIPDLMLPDAYAKPIFRQTPASSIKYHVSGETICRPFRDTRVHCEVGVGVLLNPEANLDQQSVSAKNAMDQALGFVTMISWCGRCPLSLNRTHVQLDIL